jgi:prevent-host-death family protein
MKTMDASRVRGEFAEVLDTVRDRREPVVIARYGRPLAALVPLSRLSAEERRSLDGAAAPAPSSARRPGRAR